MNPTVSAQSRANQTAFPESAQGFSWGGFLLPLIWGPFNGVWSSLLVLLPPLNLVMPFVLGFKGREWAWKSKQWNTVEEFKQTQKNWGIAGLLVNIILIPVVIFFISIISAVVLSNLHPKAQIDKSKELMLVSDANSAFQAISMYQTKIGKYPFEMVIGDKIMFSSFADTLVQDGLIKQIQANRWAKDGLYVMITGPKMNGIKVCYPSLLSKNDVCVPEEPKQKMIEPWQ